MTPIFRSHWQLQKHIHQWYLKNSQFDITYFLPNNNLENKAKVRFNYDK